MSGTHDEREINGALAGALFITLNYVVSIISMLAGTYIGHAGIWRVISALLALVAACAYIRVFDRHFPILSRIFVLLTVCATLVFFYELHIYGLNIGDFATQLLPPRYSQLLFPIALGVLTVIVWKDSRVPWGIGLALAIETLCWFAYFFATGDVGRQVDFAFAIDVSSFVAFLAFGVWLLLFGLSEKIELPKLAVFNERLHEKSEPENS